MSNNSSNLSANTNIVKLTQAELNSVTGGQSAIDAMNAANQAQQKMAFATMQQQAQGTKRSMMVQAVRDLVQNTIR
jgi:hypothetical protein